MPRYRLLLILPFALAACAAADPVVLPVPDGGFEQGGQGWSIPKDEFSAISDEQAASGACSLRITDANPKGGSNVSSPRVELPAPGLYRLTGKFFPVSGSGLGVYVRFYGADGKEVDGLRLTFTVGGSEQSWQDLDQSFLVPPGITALDLWIHSYLASQVTAYLDDLQFVQEKSVTTDMSADLKAIQERLLASALSSRADADAAAKLRDSLRADGTWEDVDYADRDATRWGPAWHVGHILTMALAWRQPGSKLHGDAKLLDAVWKGYDWWTTHDPQCPNWWYNQIGVPRTLYRAMLLVEPELSPERLAAGCKILERGKLGMTGQNLVWVAEVTIARGCLNGDALTVFAAFDRIAREVKITGGEGIQVDGSFYQHGQQLYSGGYGYGFAVDTPYFAKLAAGTAFAFPAEKLDILAHYLLDGQQWMVRGPSFDHSARGREITRRGAGSSSGMKRAVSDMLALAAPRRDEFEAFAARLNEDPLSGKHPLLGNRHFWRVDYQAHHRQAFSASVRMTSKRLLQTEVVNHENLLGRHLSDGLTYLFRTGGEYTGIFPVWNWQKLPGTTAEQNGQTKTRGGARGEQTFAGGVSDGLYGLAAMDFARGGLKARKAWLFLDDGVLCLGAGITCDSDSPVITTLNQCLQNGDVVTSSGPAAADPKLTDCRWVQHDGFGYIFPEPTAVELNVGPQQGSWRQINQAQSTQPVKLDVFDLGLNHGVKPSGASYAYLVQVGDQAATQAASAKLPVSIVVNRPELQAAWQPSTKLAAVAFYQAGSLSLPTGLTLAVDQPCLMLYRDGDEGAKVAVSNPENQPLTVNVTVGTKQLKFDLPGGLEAGGTVVMDLAAEDAR